MDKRIKYFVMLLFAAVSFLSSCTKDNLGGFGGNYTFKTGGYVTLAPMMSSGTEITMALQSESGQMDIMDNGGNGNVLITMNILGGTALVINAMVQDGVLTLAPFTRIATLMQSQDESLGAQVTISGTAKKIDNMIVFDLTYQGVTAIGGMPYSISSSHVEQIAKEN